MQPLFADSSSPTGGPLQPSNVSVVEPAMVSAVTRKVEKSPVKPASSSSTGMRMDECMKPQSNPTAGEQARSPRRRRFNALTRRCQEMSTWEDDYSYHSTTRATQVEVEGSPALRTLSDVHGSSSGLHAANPYIRVDSQASSERREGRSAIKTNGSFSPCISATTTKSDTVPATSQYYFGEGPSGNALTRDGAGSSVVSSMQKMTPPCDETLNFPPNPPTSTPHTLVSKSEVSRSKTDLRQKSSSASPTRKLAWDQGMLSSLVSAYLSMVKDEITYHTVHT